MNLSNDASQVADLGNKTGGIPRVSESGLNDLLQQQIGIGNGGSSGQSLSSLENQCLDLKTGKVLADDVLNFDDLASEDFSNLIENDETLKENGVEQLEAVSKINYTIQTRNGGLEGDQHPVTGVPFERKTVEDAEGNEVTGVFAQFDSEFDAQLPDDKLQSNDSEQFGECNDQLRDSVENDPDLAKKFTPEQLEQIRNGDTPDGYTWHHSEEKGKMQLVDSETHAQTGHTGGRAIWGGGTENR